MHAIYYLTPWASPGYPRISEVFFGFLKYLAAYFQDISFLDTFWIQKQNPARKTSQSINGYKMKIIKKLSLLSTIAQRTIAPKPYDPWL